MSIRDRILAEAADAEEAGDDGQVIAALERLLIHHPDDLLGLVWLGGKLVEVGQFESAVPHLEKALRSDPTDPSVLSLWAVAARGVGQLGSGIDVLRGIVSRTPSAAAYVLLGDALQEVGLERESQIALERAVDLRSRVRGGSVQSDDAVAPIASGKSPGSVATSSRD